MILTLKSRSRTIEVEVGKVLLGGEPAEVKESGVEDVHTATTIGGGVIVTGKLMLALVPRKAGQDA